MIDKAVIAIGVDRTGDLAPLRAAASGAREFGDWADRQGYDVTLLTDENGGRVKVGDIKDVILEIVEAHTCKQLIVYFAGHGILRAAQTELWLLSGAPRDSGEAVNLVGSARLARYSGIGHIVFISDACRSAPVTPRLNQVIGSDVFPTAALNLQRPSYVDHFYATLPFESSWEVRGENVAKAAERYDGIFTRLLLRGLHGSEPAVWETWTEDDRERYVVPAWALKPYLEEKVPRTLGDIDLSLEQYPEISVESRKPFFLAEIDPEQAPAREVDVSSTKSPIEVPTPTVATIRAIAKKIGLAVPIRMLPDAAPDEPEIPDPDGGRFRAAMKRLKTAEFPGHTDSGGTDGIFDVQMETGQTATIQIATGFTIFGEEVASARVASGHCRIGRALDGGRTHIQIERLFESNFAQKSILIQFVSGRGTTLAVLPGFIGTVVVEEGRVVSVSYLPTPSNPDKYGEFRDNAHNLRQRHAFLAAAARFGSFSLDSGTADAAGDFLRVEKAVDPTMGLYAAYAYIQAGRQDLAQSVYQYMRREPEPVLFDVALLAGQVDLVNPGPHVAPWSPLLTQGWSLLETLGQPLPEYLDRARRELVPSLWTTLTPAGVNIIDAVIPKGGTQ